MTLRRLRCLITQSRYSPSAGAPLCSSRDDLATLLELIRTGQRELLGRVRGCMAWPVDGVPVVVLDRQGFLEVWLRIRLMIPSDNQPIVWTLGSTLRNDNSPPITGDPRRGRIKVCLNSGSFNDLGAVQVPALTLFSFAEEGMLVGDAAIVTTEAVELTGRQPCSEAAARMFVGEASDRLCNGGCGRAKYTVRSWPASSKQAWEFDHVLGYPRRFRCATWPS